MLNLGFNCCFVWRWCPCIFYIDF